MTGFSFGYGHKVNLRPNNRLSGFIPGAALDLRYDRSRYLLNGGVYGSPVSVSFARSGARTATGDDGTVYDYATGVRRIVPGDGLRVTAGATNLLTHSEEFDSAVWTKASAGVASAPVVTANSAVAPNGTLTADTAVFALNGGTASSDISQLEQLPPSSLSGSAFSLFAKTADGSSRVFSVVGNGGTVASITITGVWQRFTLAETATGAAALRLRLRGGPEATAASAAIELWGAQLETGSVATDYIPTTTASETVDTDAETLDLTAIGLAADQLVSVTYSDGTTTTLNGVAGSLTLPPVADKIYARVTALKS